MAFINIGKTIELDVYDHDTTPSVIKAIQLDEGTRTVSAVIQNSRQDYDIGQNAEVKLTVLRPDKTRVQIVGETFSYNGADSTMYGAKADLSDVALAVKGTCRAQFKMTSGEQELRTEIFTISNGEALDAGDGDWAGDLDGHNLDEMAQDIEDAKTAVAEMETDVSELKSGLSDVMYPYAYEDIEQNGVDANGRNNTSSTRIRTKGFIPVMEGTSVKVSYIADGMYHVVSFYDVADFSVARIGASDYVESGAVTPVPKGAKYCRIVWKKGTAGVASITPLDISNVRIVSTQFDSIEFVNGMISGVDKKFSVQVPVKVGTLNSLGIESANTTIRLISDGFIPVTEGQNLAISWDSDLALQVSASFYVDADYALNRISASTYTVNGISKTVPDDAKFMRLLWRVGSAGTAELPLSSLSNVKVSNMPITDIVKDVIKDTRAYAIGSLFDRQNLDIDYVGDLSKQQAFCKYNGKWYSTDGSGITVQSSDLTIENTVELETGHGNGMHTGNLHPEYAYISGWNDNKVYVVNLSTLVLVNTINLPTTGYTTCAIDDLNGIAYIFQRDTYPSSNKHYNFIAYDYTNESVLYTRKTVRSFGAMQSCDIWEDKIIVANGQGKSSGRYNYYLIYNLHGDIVQEMYFPTLDTKEPEGIMFDRDADALWLGIQITSGGQSLYKISRHTT